MIGSAPLRALLIASTVLAVGCVGGEYSVEVRLPAGDITERTRAIELALLPGGCAGQSIGAPPQGAAQRVSLRRDGARTSFTPASAGTYGVYALARDSACAPVAAGCKDDVQLVPGGSGHIVVSLEAVSGAACGACDDGVCGPGELDAGPDAGGRDGGADGGARDGGSGDGGPADGGPADGGPADGGSDAGPPGPCPTVSEPIFCDDFEGLTAASPGPWSGWRLRPIGSDSEVSPARGPDPVHAGEQAARMYTPEPQAQAAMFRELDPPIAGGNLWIRAFVYVPRDSVDFTFAELSLLYLVPPSGDGLSLQLGADHNSFYLGSGLEDDPGGQRVWALPGSGVPRDVWTCVEVHFDIDDLGSAALYLDGAARGTVDDVDTLSTGGYGRIVLGLERALGDQGPATIYLDDVAISTLRPGC
jgi:hypothetical protein